MPLFVGLPDQPRIRCAATFGSKVFSETTIRALTLPSTPYFIRQYLAPTA